MAVDFGALRTLASNTQFEVHGVDATVKVEGFDDVETKVIWLPTTPEAVPGSVEFQTRAAFRVMAVRRNAVPRLPRFSVITAPERHGGEVKTWKVDGHERIEADHHRVIVIRDEAEAADAAHDDE